MFFLRLIYWLWQIVVALPLIAVGYYFVTKALVSKPAGHYMSIPPPIVAKAHAPVGPALVEAKDDRTGLREVRQTAAWILREWKYLR